MTLNSIPTPTPEPKMTEQVIKLLTDDGDPYLGRFMGVRIGEDVYLLPDGDVARALRVPRRTARGGPRRPGPGPATSTVGLLRGVPSVRPQAHCRPRQRRPVRTHRNAAHPDTPGAGDAALALAEQAWKVMPIFGKVPAIRSAHPMGDPLRGTCHGECGRPGHGFYDATHDPAIVSAMFAAFPGAGIGGTVPDRLLVLDTDPRNGGDRWLADLEAVHGPLPATLTVRSAAATAARTATTSTLAGCSPANNSSGVASTSNNRDADWSYSRRPCMRRRASPTSGPTRTPDTTAGMVRREVATQATARRAAHRPVPACDRRLTGRLVLRGAHLGRHPPGVRAGTVAARQRRWRERRLRLATSDRHRGRLRDRPARSPVRLLLEHGATGYRTGGPARPHEVSAWALLTGRTLSDAAREAMRLRERLVLA